MVMCITRGFMVGFGNNGFTNPMVLIHYSFAPLILFLVSYMLDLLPYYLSIASGTGGIDIFELLVFQCL